MGKEQYFPTSAEPLARNRLFSQYHAQNPEHERKRIVDELVNGTSNRRVLFVTVAFGIGIDLNKTPTSRTRLLLGAVPLKAT